MAPLRRAARQALPWALGLWLVGVQVQEGPATLGAYGTGALALVVAWPVRPTRTWWALLAFVGASALLPLLGLHLPTGTGLARLADFLLVPAAAMAVSQLDGRALERIGVAAAVTLLLSLAAAGFQHFGVWPGREAFVALGWTRIGFERVYETVPGQVDRFMAGGLLLHRLKFANVTAVLCLFGAAAVVLRAPRWRFFLVVTVLGLLGLWVFPHARAASVAAVLAVGVTWVAAARRRGLALLGVALLLAAAVGVGAAVPSVRARFLASASAEGSGERAALTQSGLNAIAQAPLTGVGLGRFRPGLYLPEDAPAQARNHRGKSHDQFVTIAAEAGLPAAGLLLLALLGWLGLGLRRLPAGALLVGAVALFVLLSVLHDPLFHVESSLALMLALGAGMGLVTRASGEPLPGGPGPLPPV
jgi:O-antigen ligase